MQAQNDRLRHLLLKLTRMQFGARSERLPEDQLQPGLEAFEQAIAKHQAEAEKQNPELRKDNAAKRRAGRGALPVHLPRIEVTLMPEDTACPCCRAEMTVIGEVRGTVAEGRVSPRSGTARRDPGSVPGDRDQTSQTRLPGLPRHRGAEAGAGAVDRGWPADRGSGRTRGTARYADHQPLYRQAQIMRRQGVIIERSTLSFWMGYAAAEVVPVVMRLREMMLASTRIFADETVVPVHDPGRGRTKQGYFWAIPRDDRPWGGGDPPAAVYHYAPGRGHSHANALLGGYRGILQCDDAS